MLELNYFLAVRKLLASLGTVEPPLSNPWLSGKGCELKKGVGMSTAHVHRHMANSLADCAKFLSCLTSFYGRSNRQR